MSSPHHEYISGLFENDSAPIIALLFSVLQLHCIISYIYTILSQHVLLNVLSTIVMYFYFVKLPQDHTAGYS